MVGVSAARRRLTRLGVFSEVVCAGVWLLVGPAMSGVARGEVTTKLSILSCAFVEEHGVRLWRRATGVLAGVDNFLDGDDVSDVGHLLGVAMSGVVAARGDFPTTDRSVDFARIRGVHLIENFLKSMRISFLPSRMISPSCKF